MTLTLQIILILLSVILLLLVINNINKAKVIFSDFSYWLVFIVFLIILAFTKDSAIYLSSLLGVQTPVIAVFLVVIALLILLVLNLALRVSVLNRRFIQLTQNIALLNHKINTKE